MNDRNDTMKMRGENSPYGNGYRDQRRRVQEPNPARGSLRGSRPSGNQSMADADDTLKGPRGFHDSTNMNAGNPMLISIFDGTEKPIQVDLSTFGKEQVTFGRSEDNDIVLKSSMVSRNHGWFILDRDKLAIVDNKSTNGITINNRYVREGAYINGGDIVRIDDDVDRHGRGVLILPNQSNGLNWEIHPLTGPVLIGRDSASTLQLSHVGVSKRHAEINRNSEGYYIRDLDSTNGTFVDGIRIRGRRRLDDKNIISITNTKIIFTPTALYVCTYKSGLGIDARHIIKTVGKGRKKFNICNDVSLTINPGELVAIIGGSGAGKTTFMNAISGYNRPTKGKVLINGQELYENYDSLKNIIGYVPQQDIVYDNLTLESMLTYAAKLRLPDDTTKEELASRVHKVIEMVELTGKEDTMIKKLSGGQKKRASIAVELISDPKLFFLDEPASGLDPGTERNLMRTLKNMTRDGKTIILVTHSTLNLQNCDKIVFMGKGGNLCCYANMKDAEKFFGVDNLVDVYNMITDHAEKWRSRYDSVRRDNINNIRADQSSQTDEKPTKEKSKHSPIKQTAVLAGRYLRLLINDRQRLMLVLLQAPLLALLISLVDDGNTYQGYSMTKSILFALSCSAFWIGTLNAIQEICKERVILRREYMTGLKLGPYIVSKFLILGMLCFVESVLLILVFAARVGIPDEGLIMHPLMELFITTFLTAFAASGMGLFASSMFKNPDRAMTVAPILLMPQILFSGLLFELKGMTQKISWFVVCRWSMEGYGTTANLNARSITVTSATGEKSIIPRPEAQFEDYFDFTKLHLTKDWLLLLAFVAAFGILSFIILHNIKKSD